jgi:2',3'-cyclic-nucleotide 2'-phosphodiesterase (5'-nucleotidase family)
LDANDISYAIPANYDYSGGAQTEWLQRTLAAFRADNRTDFIVVYFHHSTYSTCVSDGAEGGAQDHWSPLFDSYQVDLVLNGHNHIYERTDPIKAGQSTGVAGIGATIDPTKQGTTYVVAGGGGNSVYQFPVLDNYEGNETPNTAPVPMILNRPGKQTETVDVNWSRVRYTGYGLIAIDVAPASSGRKAMLTARALTESGTEVDRFTLVRKAK